MIKYRNGLPTKKSLNELLEAFDPRMRIMPSQLYGKDPRFNTLLWQDQYSQDKIAAFILHGKQQGIEFGEYRPYESPTVGMLTILKKEKHGTEA